LGDDAAPCPWTFDVAWPGVPVSLDSMVVMALLLHTPRPYPGWAEREQATSEDHRLFAIEGVAVSL
jgi:hypothetical protein